MSNDENEFNDWYKSKMHEITLIMDDLIKETKVSSYNNTIEPFIKDKSEECIMLKKELDKLKNLYEEGIEKSPKQEANYQFSMSPDSIGSAKYFTTNSEGKEQLNKNLVHEYGVLKRNSNTGSTPSFKPHPTSSQKQMSIFSSMHENLPANDTMGNKFDELERRLQSLENTLDGKPAMADAHPGGFKSSVQSYNPFSPPRNQPVYIHESQGHPSSAYSSRPQNQPDKSGSPRYIDSSMGDTDPNEEEGHWEQEMRKLEKLLQEAERKNAYYEEVLDQKQNEIDRYQHEEANRHHEYQALEAKLERAEKANERLKTTYEVLREQELQKVKQDLRNNEEKERVIQGYKDQIDSQNKDLTALTDRVADLSQQLRQAKGDIERLSLDKEALARIADTSGFEQKIKTLEVDLAHYKSLLENERKSRQSVVDNMNKRDSQLNEIERVNFELNNQVDLKNNIIKRNEEEIDHLKYQLSDSVKENDELRSELREQSDRIHELEEDLAQ